MIPKKKLLKSQIEELAKELKGGKKAIMETSIRNLRRILNQAHGKKCWHVSAGGSTLPQFTLALGEKIRRQKPVSNTALSREFRGFEGEISFFIRCWWRLEHGEAVIVSSNGKERDIVSGLNHLVGNTLVNAKVVQPAWDLALEFSDQWHLSVFADQDNTADDAMKNWHARIRGQKIYAGPGTKLEIVV